MIAIIQIGCGLLGVGRTTEEAIADASRWGCQIDDLDNDSSVDGNVVAMDCTERLLFAVQAGRVDGRHGWLVTDDDVVDVDDDGCYTS